MPRCVPEPLCDLDRNRRRLGFLRGDVPAGGAVPSDDEVEDDDEEADEEDGREGAVEGVVPNPSVDRTRCIVLLGLLLLLCRVVCTLRAPPPKTAEGDAEACFPVGRGPGGSLAVSRRGERRQSV
jgi:hypothetical protein